MDTSKEYIKMCEEAREIQEITKDSCGQYSQFIFIKQDLTIHKAVMVTYEEAEVVKRNNPQNYIKFVWLPRQDQLVELIKYPFGISRIFIEFTIALREDTTLSIYGDTIEKLFLMYLMKKDYNKKWNGETWQ